MNIFVGMENAADNVNGERAPGDPYIIPDKVYVIMEVKWF